MHPSPTQPSRRRFATPFYLAIVVVIAFIGVGFGSGAWQLPFSNGQADASRGQLMVSGDGTEVLDLATSPEGEKFELLSDFSFTNDEFHCTLLPNEKEFSIATYSLGHMPIPAGALTMQMDSTKIEAVNELGGNGAEIVGELVSTTKVGDMIEETATVPFRVVAVDGGEGYKEDTLIVTVFFNKESAPIQFGIFGPAPRFGWGRNVVSGDVKVWRMPIDS